MKKLLVTFLAILMILCFVVSCNNSGANTNTDEAQMLYTADTSLGSGATTFTLVVEHIDGTKINFTISTNEAILADALTSIGLVVGHDSTYGLYIDSVNGIAHNYNKDGIYWAIYEGDNYASTGVDGITIVEGAVYKLVASR